MRYSEMAKKQIVEMRAMAVMVGSTYRTSPKAKDIKERGVERNCQPPTIEISKLVIVPPLASGYKYNTPSPQTQMFSFVLGLVI
jgi:hypothetical protein